MKSIEVMDKYINTYGEQISAAKIFNVVSEIFGINLDKVSILDKKNAESLQVPTNIDTSITSPSRLAIDMRLSHLKKEITGEEVRKILNQTFGINLDGIASLERQRISLFSKGQWILQNDKDLIIVHTGIEDVDVKILPTDFFTKQTGLEELPIDLQHSLSRLGYRYDEQIRGYFYADPDGQPIPDNFKGQSLGAIIEVIQKLYAHV